MFLFSAYLIKKYIKISTVHVILLVVHAACSMDSTVTSGSSTSHTSHMWDCVEQHTLEKSPIVLHYVHAAVAARLFIPLAKCTSDPQSITRFSLPVVNRSSGTGSICLFLSFLFESKPHSLYWSCPCVCNGLGLICSRFHLTSQSQNSLSCKFRV